MARSMDDQELAAREHFLSLDPMSYRKELKEVSGILQGQRFAYALVVALSVLVIAYIPGFLMFFPTSNDLPILENSALNDALWSVLVVMPMFVFGIFGIIPILQRTGGSGFNVQLKRDLKSALK